MIPTIGRIVHYTLSGQDAVNITRRRAETGHVMHNQVAEGDVYPMLIVRVWGTTSEASVNGQVFLDGDDTFWVTSALEGDGPRHFNWPVKA